MTIYKGKSLTINNKTYSKNVELEVVENQINIIIDDISIDKDFDDIDEVAFIKLVKDNDEIVNILPGKTIGKNMVITEVCKILNQELHIKLVKSDFRATDYFKK